MKSIDDLALTAYKDLYLSNVYIDNCVKLIEHILPELYAFSKDGTVQKLLVIVNQTPLDLLQLIKYSKTLSAIYYTVDMTVMAGETRPIFLLKYRYKITVIDFLTAAYNSFLVRNIDNMLCKLVLIIDRSLHEYDLTGCCLTKKYIFYLKSASITKYLSAPSYRLIAYHSYLLDRCLNYNDLIFPGRLSAEQYYQLIWSFICATKTKAPDPLQYSEYLHGFLSGRSLKTAPFLQSKHNSHAILQNCIYKSKTSRYFILYVHKYFRAVYTNLVTNAIILESLSECMASAASAPNFQPSECHLYYLNYCFYACSPLREKLDYNNSKYQNANHYWYDMTQYNDDMFDVPYCLLRARKTNSQKHISVSQASIDSGDSSGESEIW